jgi:hypothetical protein
LIDKSIDLIVINDDYDDGHDGASSDEDENLLEQLKELEENYKEVSLELSWECSHFH